MTHSTEKGARPLYAREHHGSWWAYDPTHDSDTGPYSTREQAQEWIDAIVPADGAPEVEG